MKVSSNRKNDSLIMFKIQYTTDDDFAGRSHRPAAKTDDIIPIVRDVLTAVRDKATRR